MRATAVRGARLNPYGYVVLWQQVQSMALETRPEALAAYRAILKRHRAGTLQRGDASRLASLGQVLRLSGGVPVAEE